MGQYLAARHANPGIRLRASALHRCPRGCDKLGHFPGGPDRPGRSEAAFAVSEDLGKSHGAGGRARLGQQVGLLAQQQPPNLVHDRAFIPAQRVVRAQDVLHQDRRRLHRLPPRSAARRRAAAGSACRLGAGHGDGASGPRSPGRAEARAPVGRVASTIGCRSGELRVLTPAGGGERRKPRVDWRPRRGTGPRPRRRNLTPWQRAATSGGLPPRARAQISTGDSLPASWNECALL
ncbi:A-kinase anchor protein inhibitor 1 isoform X1 [Bos indicus x Bos taurus]|uniref:A-kinase anchor protein inhibitor 1 isoform X1 n=1 Tax=Bos indicus x Bos taurus TaxID=30522 RepID=UPI000F7D3757|nr:A-kinase anchor protein inhibitor 1 isoform X1 [Bos indicus x Bos taurus]